MDSQLGDFKEVMEEIKTMNHLFIVEVLEDCQEWRHLAEEMIFFNSDCPIQFKNFQRIILTTK